MNLSDYSQLNNCALWVASKILKDKGLLNEYPDEWHSLHDELVVYEGNDLFLQPLYVNPVKTVPRDDLNTIMHPIYDHDANFVFLGGSYFEPGNVLGDKHRWAIVLNFVANEFTIYDKGSGVNQFDRFDKCIDAVYNKIGPINELFALVRIQDQVMYQI